MLWRRALYYGYFLCSQWHGPATQRLLLRLRLGRLLQHAYRRTDYYRQLFDAAGVVRRGRVDLEAFGSIPVTTKSDLRDAGLDRVLARSTRPERCVVKHTSGSTGEPFRVFLRLADNDVLSALSARNYTVNGLGLTSRRLELDHPLAVEHDEGLLQRLGLWQKLHASTLEPPGRQVELINRCRPDVIVAYPSVLRELCLHLRDQRPEVFRPRLVFSRSELLDDDTRRLVRAVLGAEVFDYYGCWEMGLFAFECQARDGYHVSQETTLVELVGATGQPIGEDEVGQLVCTNLFSYAMPFIRYRVGDLAAVTRAPCACGRRGLRLKQLHGRADDVLLLPGGERVLPSTVILSFRGVENVARFQVSQRSADRLHVRVVLADGGASATAVARTIDQVRSRLAEATRGQLHLDIAIAGTLERSSGGKLKTVSCELGGSGGSRADDRLDQPRPGGERSQE